MLEGHLSFKQKGISSKAESGSNIKNYGFLFNDLLLLCDEKQKDDSEQPFVFVTGLQTKGLACQKDGNKTLVVSNNGETLVLEFKASKTRTSWLKCLEQK